VPHAVPHLIAPLGFQAVAYAPPEFSLVLIRTPEETKFGAIKSPALRFLGNPKPVQPRLKPVFPYAPTQRAATTPETLTIPVL